MALQIARLGGRWPTWAFEGVRRPRCRGWRCLFFFSPRVVVRVGFWTLETRGGDWGWRVGGGEVEKGKGTYYDSLCDYTGWEEGGVSIVVGFWN